MITRRFFLIGSAVAVAAARVPLALTERVSIAPFSADTVDRMLSSFLFIGSSSAPTEFKLFYPEATSPIIRFAVGPGGSMKYVAVPGHEIPVRRDEVLRFRVTPDVDLGSAELELAYMTPAGGVYDVFDWPGGGPVRRRTVDENQLYRGV